MVVAVHSEDLLHVDHLTTESSVALLEVETWHCNMLA